MAQPSVLVVEDERTIAMLLVNIVAECGAEATIAHNGAEALREMALRRPDLVLLDLIMPVMTGEDVLREMRTDLRLADVPVVIITTKDMAPNDPGPHTTFLQKPFAPADVRAHVRAALNLSA